jgi:hypothetical protein
MPLPIFSIKSQSGGSATEREANDTDQTPITAFEQNENYVDSA